MKVPAPGVVIPRAGYGKARDEEGAELPLFWWAWNAASSGGT